MSVLRDLLVVELGGLAPVPFAGMVLADWGAHVVKIARAGIQPEDRLTRGKLVLSIDLRSEEGRGHVRALLAKADVLLDPYRPGVLERLGLAPDALLAANPRLVVARLTGYGQAGPLAQAAGHDINYLAVSGVLSLLGRADAPPTPPVNLLADFAGGGLVCVLGVLLALLERARSGRGQVVDAAMVDGAAYLAAFVAANRDALWGAPRGHNLLDSGAPFYDTYATSDARFIAVGCLEPPFFARFLRALRLPDDEAAALQAAQMDPAAWPAMRRRFAELIAAQPAAHWAAAFAAEPDACATLVASFGGAHAHPHAVARRIVPDAAGAPPAPRLSRTPPLHTTEPGAALAAQRAVRALIVTRGALSDATVARLEEGAGAQAAAL